MINKIIAILIEFLKKDLGVKVGSILVSAGVMLLGGFQIVINVVPETIKLQQSQNYVLTIGGILISIGTLILVHRYYVWNKDNDITDIGLFYFPGFTNINPSPPLNALPQNKRKKVKEISLGKIDSYNVDLIVKEYPLWYTIIERRSEHANIKQAYIAALGAVPYLYIIGTLFRDGHLPTQILEHDRNSNKWHQLAVLGKPQQVQYKYQNLSGRDSMINIKPNDNNELGVSISFTHKILQSELPQTIKDHTVDLCLDSGQSFDALPCESIQDDIVKEISHLLTSLAKKSSKIHLFISAQASIVVKLGKAYHNNMTGKVDVYNYDPKLKAYNWAIEFSGKKIITSIKIA